MNQKDKQPLRRGALGKGISSLLGESAQTESDDAGINAGLITKEFSIRNSPEILNIDPNIIDPNPSQPRKIFDENAIRELAASLKQDGFLQPILVSQGASPGRYTIVAGERRWRASKIAGLDSVPVLVKEGVKSDLLRLALIENIQRADLNIMEEAEAYSSLIKELGLTQEQVADRVGKDRSTVTNILRLLALPKEIRDDITNGRLSMGHGRAILSLDDKKAMLRCRDLVLKKQLSVRQTEQLVKGFKQPVSDNGSKSQNALGDDADLQYITESLRGHLHTKVRIAGNASRGRIEISYFSTAELERILKAMGHPV